MAETEFEREQNEKELQDGQNGANSLIELDEGSLTSMVLDNSVPDKDKSQQHRIATMLFELTISNWSSCQFLLLKSIQRKHNSQIDICVIQQPMYS
jgi:hypothetical protein